MTNTSNNENSIKRILFVINSLSGGGAERVLSVLCNEMIEKGIAVFPGCVTPTEIMAAMSLGLDVLKFFPANIYGGVSAMKALSGPFPEVKFMPTGGADLSNLKDFLIPQVIAVGGG